MPKKSRPEKPVSGIPMSIRIPGPLKAKLEQIAREHALSTHDVARLCLSAGQDIVIRKLQEINSGSAQAA